MKPPSKTNGDSASREKEYEGRARIRVMGVEAGVQKASAPAKCILFGEHAVVYGEPAVAVALEQRLQVQLTPSKSWSVGGSQLQSERHPHIVALKDALLDDSIPPMSIHITSDIPRASGLGSSAALSAAVGHAFATLAEHKNISNEALSTLAHQAEAQAQGGLASPLDTSTSTEGGVVVLSDKKETFCTWLYTRRLAVPTGERVWEVHSLELKRNDDIYLVLGNTGVHAPTSAQVALVASALEESPERIQEIKAIGTISRRGLDALQRGDYTAVGHAMSENHVLLRNLGVSSPELEDLIKAALPTSLGVKLTGAGGGGCMVALTRRPKETAEAIELAGGRTFVSRIGNAGAGTDEVNI